jgi:RHS repeat-associated protein
LSDSLVGDANPFYGRVVYGPGLAIDQPLSVTRYEYRDNPDGAPAQTWPTFTLVPFWDYRGTPVFGLYADGTRSKPYGAGGTSCAPIGTGTTNRCVLLSWPFASSAYAQDRGLLLTYSWHGSLLQKKRDASGLTYMRNRMYDPSTGRFTQEDPIGLAGGMNAYGFAGGDPVNASDPFGLCPVGASKTSNGGCPGDSKNAPHFHEEGLEDASFAFMPGLGELAVAADVGKIAIGTTSWLGRKALKRGLVELTGEAVANAHAHHIFPWVMRARFYKLGIDVSKAEYGTWWEATSHLRNSRAWQRDWEIFFSQPKTRAEVLDYGRNLAKTYGLEWHF